MSMQFPEPSVTPQFQTRQMNALIAEAIEQSPILKTGDASWLANPSMRRALKLNASIYGKNLRVYGGLLSLTHPIRTAHRVFNFEGKGFRTHSIPSAFIALNHDTVEDVAGHRTAQKDKIACDQIMDCWLGSRLVVPIIRREITALTNSPGLAGSKAADEQMARATGKATPETNYTARTIVIRYLEKLDTVEGDRDFTKTPGVERFDIFMRMEAAESKFDLIRAMSKLTNSPIGSVETLHFLDVIDEMKRIAKPVSRPQSPVVARRKELKT